MKSRYVAHYVHISAITTDPAFICRWRRIHQIHDRYSRSVRFSGFQKSVVSITGTNDASPDKLPFDLNDRCIRSPADQLSSFTATQDNAQRALAEVSE